MDLVLRSRRVVLPDGERPASVRVVDGRIAAIGPYDVPGEEVEVLLPGLVDTHVHVNEPGRTEWEGFATATRAAAAGGVTTIVDMPLNSLPPTVDAAALAVKREAAEGRISVDVGFWGGAVPTNLADLRGLHTAGVYGFKCFLADSGVEEFPDLSWPQLSAVLAELGTFGGLLIVHAEDAATLAASPEAHGGRYADFVASRPDEVEENAVTRLLAEARATGARVHILHLSSARTLPAIAAAKADGVRVTVETCPHYLTLTAEEVPDGATAFKCCPPVRGEANRDLLWQALADGTIDCVVSDHSPSPPELKTDDFGTAWGGIASLQLGLPLIWTEARRRGHTLADVVRWMSATPARIAGLAGKGAIAVGNDADLVAFAPDARLTVDVRELHHRHPVSPYAGRALDGVVRRTWLRGVPVSATPAGRLLTRGES